MDGALASLLERERELLSTLSATDRQTLGSLLRTLLMPFER